MEMTKDKDLIATHRDTKQCAYRNELVSGETSRDTARVIEELLDAHFSARPGGGMVVTDNVDAGQISVVGVHLKTVQLKEVIEFFLSVPQSKYRDMRDGQRLLPDREPGFVYSPSPVQQD